MGEEAAKDMLLELVQEMYEQNSYRVPAAKRVRDATGLSLAEAKDLLDECKPMLKKPKPGSAKPAAPPEEDCRDETGKREGGGEGSQE